MGIQKTERIFLKIITNISENKKKLLYTKVKKLFGLPGYSGEVEAWFASGIWDKKRR